MSKKDKLREWDEPIAKEVINNRVVEVKEKIVEEEKVEEIIEVPKVVKPRNKKWDFEVGDDVSYFDSSLSYEHTGYRPINMEQGLDFDPKPFQEDAENYLKTGKYCNYPPGSKLYADFWRERFRRCREGYTVGKYTITGDNYFFLNFYRLPNVRQYKSSEIESFPNFYVKQYEFFHYVALCEQLGYDVNSLKSRGVGWSEIAANLAVCPYTVKKKQRIVLSAYSEGHLSPLVSKCWTQLDFLNQHTQGGFRRIRLVKNQDLLKRASKKDKQGNESGHMSEIQGIIAANPRNLRGNRTQRLFFEESGSDPILVTKYNQAEALVKVLEERMGTRFTWGTGGDSGIALAGLAAIFYNPREFGVLPYKHNYNDKGETVYTGFFIPAYSLVDKFTDERGVTNEDQAREYYEIVRKDKSSNPQNLLEYKSEYCFTPEEALIRQGEDIFNSVLLSEQLANIDLHKNVELPVAGRLSWDLLPEGKANTSSIPKWEQTNAGNILILEHPIKSPDGGSYRNLYVAGIDSIDADKDSSTGQKQVSDFCIVIKRKQFGLLEPKYVAMYKARPNDVRDAYNTALKLLQYYDAKAVIETTRVGLITHFKNLNKTGYLMKRPRATISDVMKGNPNMFGVPATPVVITHYLELINNYINDYCFSIHFRDMIDQALKYSIELKKKFDIIAAMGMCELADEELHGYQPKPKTVSSDKWQDIGFYRDENGRKKWGVIPKNIRQYTQWQRQN